MENSLKVVDESDIYYSRQRFKNRVFAQLVAFVEDRASRYNFTQRDLSNALQKDAGQVNRWLSKPSNLTLDTISDLLTALDAEMDTRIVPFDERPHANYMHPLMEKLAVAPVAMQPRRIDQQALLRARIRGKESRTDEVSLVS